MHTLRDVARPARLSRAVAPLAALLAAVGPSCSSWNPFSDPDRPFAAPFKVTCSRDYERTSAPLRARFDAGDSRPGENSGKTITYQWSFRDGSADEKLVTEINPIDHIFPNKGRFRVSLVVQNENLSTAESPAQEVQVGNKRPTAVLTVAPEIPVAGQPVTLSARGSADSDGDIAFYVFNPNDPQDKGEEESPFSPVDCSAQHVKHEGDRPRQSADSFPWVFDTPGSYKVTLSAIDNNDEPSAIRASTLVRVKEAPITVTITSPTEDDPPIKGPVTLRARTTGPVRVVEFRVSGRPVRVAKAPAPFEADWDSNEVEDGDYDLTAHAFDASNNRAEAQPVRIRIRNRS